jgi:hypothetical protein
MRARWRAPSTSTGFDALMGTVAGDDTVLCILEDNVSAKRFPQASRRTLGPGYPASTGPESPK